MLKILPEKADIVKDQIKIRLSSTGDDNEYFGAERVDVTYT